MAQAFYRKYRSKSLAELVGQEHITQTLANAVKAGRISHAYLFTGPRGVGKTSVARILAHEINRLPYSDAGHLDIIEIDAASNRRIDDIRDLRDKVHIAPASAAYKVYIIDEVHMLTQESFNALLKTLEEPPAHVVFILATTEAHKLPATIISRTQRFSFRPVEQDKVIAHLRHIAAQEGIAITDEALALVAEHGEGSFRDSIGLLDQLAGTAGGKITAETVEQTLGLAPGKLVDALVAAVAAKDSAGVTAQLAALAGQGVATTSLLAQLLRAVGTAASAEPRLYALLDELLEVPRAYNPKLKLTTTLMRFVLEDGAAGAAPAAAAAAKPPSKTPAKTAAAPPAGPPAPSKKPPAAVVTAAPPAISVSKPVVKPGRAAGQGSQNAASEPAFAGTRLDVLSAEGWGQVLAAVRTHSAPLHGILCQAEPRFDAAAQTLTLLFRYPLHARKMEDVKNKNVLARLIQETLGGAPAITSQADPSLAAAQPGGATPASAASQPGGPHPQPAESSTAAPPPAPAAVIANTRPSDPVAQNVIELMGGGEVVHV